MYFKQRHDTSSKSKYQRFVALTSGTTARLWTGWTAPPRPWLKKHWLQKKVLKRSFTTSEQFTFCKVKISICYNLPFGFMNKHDSNLVPHVFAKDKNSSITKEQFSQSFVLTFLVTKSSAGETLMEMCKRNKVYKSQNEWPTCQRPTSPHEQPDNQGGDFLQAPETMIVVQNYLVVFKIHYETAATIFLPGTKYRYLPIPQLLEFRITCPSPPMVCQTSRLPATGATFRPNLDDGLVVDILIIAISEDFRENLWVP